LACEHQDFSVAFGRKFEEASSDIQIISGERQPPRLGGLPAQKRNTLFVVH